ncbi:hypothetical protein Hamer_G003571 [Homarus americanus]|uniref:Uncharacterized protein n=1 Tax=Homarus americanus TaxID=6706 RepID=A0A8J5K0N3_HOMAM|nr:hypothetical protein Hamer_G003571 [Homarus americanus]
MTGSLQLRCKGGAGSPTITWLMVMLVSTCFLFNTSRNFQIFGWTEVMLACIWLYHPTKELLVRGKSSATRS